MTETTNEYSWKNLTNKLKGFKGVIRLYETITKCSELSPIKCCKGELNYRKDLNSSK